MRLDFGRLIVQAWGRQISAQWIADMFRGNQRRLRRRGGVPVAALESRTLLSTFVVTSAADNTTADGLTTLREAILLANGSEGADTITFGDGTANGGTNFTDGTPDTILLSMGQMTISESLTITGLSAANTIIDGNNASRIFSITSGDTTLEKLTLTRGRTTTESTAGRGGAIYSNSIGTLTVSQSTLSGNSTTGNNAGGGAIFGRFNGAVSVSQSTLSGNSTNFGHGGAIFAYGGVTVNQSTLSGNSTTGGGNGGAIYNHSSAVTVSQSTLSGNSTASDGGAIFAANGAVTVSQSTLSGNSTTGGRNGGAIYSGRGALRVSQSTLTGNSVGGFANGGAIFTSEGAVTVSQSTLTGNHATLGAGGGIYSREALITISNSIVAGNTGTSPDIRKGFRALTVSHSLIGDNTGIASAFPATVGSTPDANGNFIGSGASPINPLLGPLQDNGGPTFTRALLIGSLALNHGSNALAVNVTQVGNPALTTDQRGVGFARIFGGTVDMGAFENIPPPTATIVVAGTSLIVGETSLVTITFSEAVTGFTNADLTIANGTLSAVSSGDGGVTWTATLTPNAAVTDATNQIALDLTGVTGVIAGVGTQDSNNYDIDTQRPTVTIVVADDALTLRETSLVTFTFSEAVSGFDNSDLTIANGTLTAVASVDGGLTWTATFTPTAMVTDTTNVITLDTALVTDLAGNAGVGTTSSPNYTIDTLRPTAVIALADTALKAGETSLVTFTFNEAVVGFTNADLILPNGTLTPVTSVNGGLTWTATFTPTVNIQDATNIITLLNKSYTDLAGNIGTGSNSTNYTVDTRRPTVVITMLDTSLKSKEISLVKFTFSEAVTGFENADLTIENGTLTAVASANGGVTWTAIFTPTANIQDVGNVISLNTALIADLAGNAGVGTTSSPNYTIDTLRPTAVITLSDTALLAGETSLVTITFNEAIIGFDNADLILPNGTLTPVTSVNGGLIWTATFTPTANIQDATNIITLLNQSYTDLAGNVGTGSNSPNYTIDTLRPTVTILMADNSLLVGETSLVTFTFSEAVTGFDNSDLAIANGTLTAVATLNGGFTWTAIFTPTVGIIDATNLITLDKSLITDLNGNAGSGTASSNNYAITT